MHVSIYRAVFGRRKNWGRTALGLGYQQNLARKFHYFLLFFDLSKLDGLLSDKFSFLKLAGHIGRKK